jgi:hypothetical protein
LVLDFVDKVVQKRRLLRVLGGFSRAKRLVRIAAVAQVFYPPMYMSDAAVEGWTPE